MKNRINLLPLEGEFYKANLHSHTTISDGRLTPCQDKEAYKRRGYHILAITDHRIYGNHEELNEEDFLVIPAIEVDINQVSAERLCPEDKTYHINLYDTRPDFKAEEKKKGICPQRRYGDFEYINSYIQDMKELGFLACYNHPYWSMQSYEDYSGLKGFFAMEIYNHGCEHDGLYGYNPQAYDEMLRLGNRMWCVATDDNHNCFPLDAPLSDSFGGFTMIKSKELTLDAVMQALIKGEFYCSMGPEIHELYIERDELVVKTSPVQKIYVKMDATRCYRKVDLSEKGLTEARFKLDGNEKYIRVEIKDKDGKFANSNAYFLEDIGYGEGEN